jgi:23S rRNA U2552 (ribose-2'-O)-methylase RlmE/FtsJ
VNNLYIIIFKCNELNKELFVNESKFYEYTSFDNINSLKNIEYGNFLDLDNTKCKIDLLDTNHEKCRRAAAKYLHEYELIKLICKKQVISRAYFKLYELIFFEEIMNLHTLDCLFICEAPGGFIECVTDIRRKRNLRTSYISISKDSDIKYDKYLEQENLLYGDITSIEVIDKTINTIKKRFESEMDLITADGGFNIKVFNSQEIISDKLIICEIFIALNTQKKNGMFIIKYFDMFTHNSVMSYLILCTFYEEVKIIKPITSRNSNSERYLVCNSFIGINDSNRKVIENLRDIIINYKFIEPSEQSKSSGIHTLIYPYFEFSQVPKLKEQINKFNTIILKKQIETINESVKMVYTKDLYFQNLLIQLFLDKVPIKQIFCYKNILSNRILKCINWLRIYKINTHQMVYRFN